EAPLRRDRSGNGGVGAAGVTDWTDIRTRTREAEHDPTPRTVRDRPRPVPARAERRGLRRDGPAWPVRVHGRGPAVPPRREADRAGAHRPLRRAARGGG